MTHLPQAGLCQDCLNQLAASLRDDPHQRVNLSWCPHRMTMAQAVIDDGRVVGWQLRSPVTESEAHEIFRAQSTIADPVTPLPGGSIN